ncbi:MAG: Ig-like domain-containing protein, partial [Oscillospiraceae bacterium]|nr:Ig-like domain-containing protein [Oscillospiraceae bacterium]
MKTKRIISLILVFVMMLSLLPTMSYAEEEKANTEPRVHEYNITTGALHADKMPKLSTANSDDLGLRNNGALYNFALADWLATLSVDANGSACDPYATMDLSKTDTYSIEYPRLFTVDKPAGGTQTIANGLSSWSMTAKTLFAGFKEKGRFGEAYMSYRPHVTLRIKVSAPGEYTLAAKGPKAANGAIPTVHFGKASDTRIEGYAWHDTFANLFGSLSEIGKWSSRTGSAADDEYADIGKVTVSAPGEYFVVFSMPEAYDAAIDPDSATNYQTFNLSGVKLTPNVEPRVYEYNITTGSLHTDKMPKLSTANVDDQGIRSNGALYNFALADWLATLSVDASGAACEPYATMNLNGTDAYSIEYPRLFTADKPAGGTQAVANGLTSWSMTSKTLFAGFKENGRFGESYMSYRPHVTLRIKVSAPGEYMLSAKGPKAANGAIPTVHFGKASDTRIEGYAWHNTFANLLGNLSEIGKWSSRTGSAADDEYADIGKVTVSAPGEYFVSFHMPDAYDAATDPDSATNYQTFNLSGVKLTPYTAPEIPDEPRELNYRVAFDVLSTNLYKYSAAPAVKTWYTIDGLRNASGGLLYNTKLMDYNATVTTDASGNTVAPFNVINQSKTDDWEWAMDYTPGTLAIAAKQNALWQNYPVSSYGSFSSGGFLMIRVNVPVAGKYTLSYNGTRAEGAAAPAIYFFADDGSEMIDRNSGYRLFSTQTPIGYANFSDTSKTGYVNVGTAEVPTAGDYFIVLFPNQKSLEISPASGAYQEIFLTDLKLTPFEEGDDVDKLESISLSADETLIEAGNTATITAIGKYSLSGAAEIADDITYKSSDNGIATVSDKGVVTGVAEGKVTITASVGDVSATIDIDVMAYDAGNGGVMLEYRTTWDALSGDKLPQTTDSAKYSNGTYARNASGGLIVNLKLMNRNATAVIDKNEQTVPAWNIMNFDITDPWDVAFEKSPGGIRIQKKTNDLFLNYPVDGYGNTSSGTFMALRLNVPHKGKYRLMLDTSAVAHGVASAIYFIRDNGTVTGVNQMYALMAANEPVAHFDFSESFTGYKKVCEVEVPRAGEYFIIFFGDEKSLSINSTTTGDAVKYQEIHLEGIRLFCVPGEPEKLELSLKGLEEGDPMALYTKRQIAYELFDANDVPLDEIDESKLTVTYSSSDSAVATVSESGEIEALSNGTTTITVNVNYDGTKISKEYELLVAPTGKNLMADKNPDFESDLWVWNWPRQDELVGEPKFMRLGINKAPTSENPENRALAVALDGKSIGGVPDSINLIPGSDRVKAEPGRLYELSFKMKIDYENPPGGEDLLLYLDYYTYSNPTGQTGSDIPVNSGRSVEISQAAGWREIYSDWVEVVLPVPGPMEAPGLEALYITPRFGPRPRAGDYNRDGHKGIMWFDDFEIREVGFAGVEVSIEGETTASNANGIFVKSKPYTSTGSYISLGGTFEANDVKLSASDKNVVSDFGNQTIEKADTGSGQGISHGIGNAAVKLGGKNGNADVFSEITLNGITRIGKSTLTTSGFDMRLLYAEAYGESDTVEAGGKTKIVPVGYMSDGSVADMSSGTITYKSLTPDILTVDKESGEVAALGAGKGRVEVNFLLGKFGAQAIAEITVTDSSPIVSATLTECPKVGYLRDEKLALAGLTEKGFAADLAAADIEWIVECDPVGGVTVSEDGYIFGEIFGASAKVKAKITLNGATVETNEIEVSVSETDLRDFSIDFRKASESKPSKVQIEVDGWELDLKKSQSTVASSVFDTMGLNGNTSAANSDMVMRVNVPYTGYYQIVLHIGLGGYSATEGSVFVDNTYLGTVDWEGMNQSAVRENLRSVYLTAGEHEFIFRALKRGPYGAQQILKELRFRALNELPAMERINAPESLAITVGEKMNIGASVTTSDGFTYAGEKSADGSVDKLISFEYESVDSNIASISSTGELVAAAAGDTEIIIRVSSGDDEISHTVGVNVAAAVADDNVLSTAEIKSASFVMSAGAAGTQLSAIGKNAAGRELDLSEAEIIWESSDSSVASVTADGFVAPHGIGTADITLTIIHNGLEKSVTRTVSVREGKVSRTYYTDEMVAAARENISKYSWANDEYKSVIKAADRYLSRQDELYNMIPGEGIPR